MTTDEDVSYIGRLEDSAGRTVFEISGLIETADDAVSAVREHIGQHPKGSRIVVVKVVCTVVRDSPA